MGTGKKRRGPFAAGSTLGNKVGRKVGFSFRVKKEVLDFLRIGGDYHGVGFTTYMQWLVERALLDEIHYYGWNLIRPVGFEQQQSEEAAEHREFLHLNRTARRRERDSTTPAGRSSGT